MLHVNVHGTEDTNGLLVQPDFGGLARMQRRQRRALQREYISATGQRQKSSHFGLYVKEISGLGAGRPLLGHTLTDHDAGDTRTLRTVAKYMANFE